MICLCVVAGMPPTVVLDTYLSVGIKRNDDVSSFQTSGVITATHKTD